MAWNEREHSEVESRFLLYNLTVYVNVFSPYNVEICNTMFHDINIV